MAHEVSASWPENPRELAAQRLQCAGHMKTLCCLPLLCLLYACATSHGPPLDPDEGSAANDAATTPPDAGSACDAVNALDDACRVNSDCIVVVHQSDCCGSTIALGVAGRALASFELEEPLCGASYPECECATRGLRTESGELVAHGSTVLVSCVGHRCTTSVAPDVHSQGGVL